MGQPIHALQSTKRKNKGRSFATCLLWLFALTAFIFLSVSFETANAEDRGSTEKTIGTFHSILQLQMKDRPGGGGQPPTAIVDLHFCITDVNASGPCVAPDESFTDQGGGIVNGIEYRVYQQKGVVRPGDTVLTDISFQTYPIVYGYSFEPPDDDPLYYQLHNFQCSQFNPFWPVHYDCFAVWVRYGEFPSQEFLVNTQYCNIPSAQGDTNCQLAPTAIDPPSEIFRPTYTGNAICNAGAPVCHDSYVEKKTVGTD